MDFVETLQHGSEKGRSLFEGASDKKVTLARVGPLSGVMRLAQLVARRFQPPTMTSLVLPKEDEERLVIRRRCSNAISHEAQQGCMRECFVYWSERVLWSWMTTGTQRVVLTTIAHSCTSFRSVVRQVTVDAVRRFPIRFEPHLFPVWTFRRDDHVRESRNDANDGLGACLCGFD